MRKITAPSTWLLLLALLLFSFSGVSSASTITYYTLNPPWDANARSATPLDACKTYNPNVNATYRYNGYCYRTIWGSESYIGTVTAYSNINCPFGNTGLTCNASCDSPNVMQNGQCVPYVDPCSSKSNAPTGWKKTWPSYEAYNSDSAKPKCTTSQNGCSVDICGSTGSSSCGQSGETGEYACYGNGTYTGTSQEASEGGDVDGCEGAACQPPPPVTSSSEQSCTPNVNGSFTCVKNDVSSQFSGSECTVGSVGGATGYVCVKPDYVPQSDNKTTEDVVTETTNPDGSKNTVTETTTTHTTCKAGACTTTTTTTTNTKGTNADGSPGDTSTVCTGDKCDNPATDKDESKEDEEEEEVERTVSGENCNTSLACDGDAIDCAILNQQKLMRCSMDWETQKGAVLAEAGKSEYQLQTTEFNASSLFSGPSASRWLSTSCPADRTINLSSSGTAVSFSWTPVCDYASVMGYLFVFSASLFFAHYVGRAFGGD